MTIPVSLGLCVLAGLCEIGGGYLVWQWLREGRPAGFGLLGGILLMTYGVIFPHCNMRTLDDCMRHRVACLLFYRYFGGGHWMEPGLTDLM